MAQKQSNRKTLIPQNYGQIAGLGVLKFNVVIYMYLYSPLQTISPSGVEIF